MPTSKQIDALLSETHTALENAHQSSLQDQIAPYGLTPEKLAEGVALRDALQDAYQANHVRYGDAEAAMHDHVTAHDALRATYVRHVTIARVVFADDDDATERLALSGRRPRTRGGLVQAARMFYETLHDDTALQSAMAAVNVDAETVADALEALDRVDALARRRTRAEAEARASTAARDDAEKALRRWMRDFWTLATLALEGTQGLEALGRTAPS